MTVWVVILDYHYENTPILDIFHKKEDAIVAAEKWMSESYTSSGWKKYHSTDEDISWEGSSISVHVEKWNVN